MDRLAIPERCHFDSCAMTARFTRRTQRGFTLVELLVGVTISLFIVAAGTFILTQQLRDNTRLLLQAQVGQELRVAADLIARDLRRAGYSDLALQQLPDDGALPNPFTAIDIQQNRTPRIQFNYAQVENDRVDTDEWRSGFKLDGGVISIKLGQDSAGRDNWQPVTDPSVARITQFDITSTVQPIALSSYCPVEPSPGSTGPRLEVRDVRIRIVAEAAQDSSIRRDLTAHAKLRNDRVVGACPGV